MPKIKAFKGIHPAQTHVDRVVLQVENLDIASAKRIRNQNPYSFVNMLVPKLENRFLMGSKTELAFKKINDNFDDYLEKGILLQDQQPAIYVYQVKHLGLTQAGFWTVTAIDDYLNNTIRKHELTRAEREKSLIDYVQQTGIDANPVLITYPTDETLSQIIKETLLKQPLLHFNRQDAEHCLWKIDDEAILNTITQAFARLKSTYIADGHHRAAAASSYGIERRKFNLKHTGNEEYNFFTSVYMPTDQIHIFEFHRLIKSLGKLSVNQLLKELEADFDLKELTNIRVFKPGYMHQIGLYVASKWYELNYREPAVRPDNPVEKLDVSILQNRVLTRILQIKDPRTDPRLSFAGGITHIADLVKKVDDGEFDALFTLFPTSIEELIQVADAGEVMPPKSTWFEPKFQAGLLIHKVN
ncbi:MAG: DUF1015 domain-containing protein [Sphingobacteriaceae bacterium]